MLAVVTSNRPPLWIGLAVACACLGAIADWPYGYYQILRLAVTIYGSWMAMEMWMQERVSWAWAFGSIAILYNPIFKISLDRDTWVIANLVAAVFFAAEIAIFKRRAIAS